MILAASPVVAVRIPHLYNGHDRTFFFGSYEGLRLPREFPLVESFPSLDMRNGNLWNYLVATQGTQTPVDQQLRWHADSLHRPVELLGSGISGGCECHQVPDAAAQQRPRRTRSRTTMSPIFPAPISSNQFDVRIDQKITTNQSIYGRYTFKNRSVTTAPAVNCAGFCDTSLSPLLGGVSQPEQDRGLTVAYNYTITPNVINEFRGGFNAIRTSLDANVNSATLIDQVGITGIPDIATVPTVPDIEIAGLQRTGGLNTTNQQSKIIQLLDDLTWVKG